MKKIILLSMLFGMAMALQAQPLVTIQDIQTVSPATLANCVDTSTYLNDTVTVRGVVLMDGGLAQAGGGRNIWIQSGTAPFSGLDVFTTAPGPVPNTPDDILDLVAGDSIEITGIILEFGGSETEIVPLTVSLEGIGVLPAPTVIPISDLNDNNNNNLLTTGEQWEGMLVEIQNVTVTNVTYFSGGNRVSFIVTDAQGNAVGISDRFLAQRLPASGGTFVPPNVGTQYDYIRGVISHSPNGCTGSGGRGYELYPYDASHYQVTAGSSAPLISGIVRNPGAPTSSQDANVTATIEDVDGNVVTAELKYAIGIGSTTYTSIPMTNTAGNTWTAAIPNTAFSDGDFVKYYITATDNDNLTANIPAVPSGAGDPLFFTIRDNGLTIYDLQFTPYGNGNSGYVGLDVSVTGIVTSTAELDNLGVVFIEQASGATSWKGIQLVPGAATPTGLSIGDEVQVGGTVQEDFGFTRLQVNSISTLSSGNMLTPTDVDPDLFSTYDVATNEQYEGMLLTLKNPGTGKLYIVEENPDAPSNFGEYRIGADLFAPNGSRILTGRNTGSAPGSLNVSYINDSTWITNSGVMNVPAYVVTYGDSMDSVTGIMFYSFGNMKLLPRTNDDFQGYQGAMGGGVGIADALAGSQIVAFPNPNQGTLFLNYRFPKAVQAQVNLTDLAGRQLLRQEISGIEGQTRLNTSQLSNGLYLITVTVEGVVIGRQKVVVGK